MKRFMDLIKNQNYHHGETLEPEALIVAQKGLCNMGLDFIPPSYADFLKHYNGIKYDGSYLFGATVDDDLDILDKNEQMSRPENCILLGCNEFDLLCYNYRQKVYQIVDRTDFEVLDIYADGERDMALAQILNL